MTLIHSALAGGSWIDDCDRLRAGSTSSVLGHRVLVPSTIGTFLRSFSFGTGDIGKKKHGESRTAVRRRASCQLGGGLPDHRRGRAAARRLQALALQPGERVLLLDTDRSAIV
jgi:hypothetical protein